MYTVAKKVIKLLAVKQPPLTLSGCCQHTVIDTDPTPAILIMGIDGK
jgi:hypothetical protein